MTQTLAERVEALEQEMAEVRSQLPHPTSAKAKPWMSTFGMFSNDPLFEAAMDAGESWRKEQTWEKEKALAGHAGS
jgi:hypothetical protein